jgi:2-phospho-L-lactate/phosphoenolpyruvate guanylyltransferase
MKACVLLPIKTLSQCKQRLAGFLSPSVRETLAVAMTRDVLNALTQARRVAEIAVITRDPSVIEVVKPYGVRVIVDHIDDGHNRAAAIGIRHLVSIGATNAMMVPIDVPLVTGNEIDAVVAAHSSQTPAFTIVPSHDGFGTNCTLSSPPGIVEPLFGSGSLRLYCEAARRIDADLRVINSPGLGLDIDTLDDVETFLRANRPTHATEVIMKAVFGNRTAANK